MGRAAQKKMSRGWFFRRRPVTEITIPRDVFIYNRPKPFGKGKKEKFLKTAPSSPLPA
jgi:hypothetical protein